jgi:hypothetical protein
VAAKLPFKIHAHMPCCWLRPGGSGSRHKDASGLYGPSLDCEHRRLYRGGRQARSKHLGQMSKVRSERPEAEDALEPNTTPHLPA